MYQTITNLQQGDDTVDRFYSRFCSLWHQIDLLTPVECSVAAAHSVTCTGTCALRRRHEETRRMYDFIMRLRPEYEQFRSQLLHSPSAYPTFAIVLA